jgi:hypothetical protein
MGNHLSKVLYIVTLYRGGGVQYGGGGRGETSRHVHLLLKHPLHSNMITYPFDQKNK